MLAGGGCVQLPRILVGPVQFRGSSCLTRRFTPRIRINYVDVCVHSYVHVSVINVYRAGPCQDNSCMFLHSSLFINMSS